MVLSVEQYSGEGMLSVQRRSFPKIRRDSKPSTTRTFLGEVGIFRDLLALSVKLSLLFCPAAIVLLYLRSIGRVDLFQPAVLSVTGLVALLQGTLLLSFAIVATIAGPSAVAWLISQTYVKERPTRGVSNLVLIVGICGAGLCVYIYLLWHGALCLWMRALPVQLAFLAAILAALFHWANRTSGRFHVLTFAEKRGKTTREAVFIVGLRLAIAIAAVGWAFIIVSPFARAVMRSGGLDSEGWMLAVTAITVFFGVLPAVISLRELSRGRTWRRALGAHATALAMVTFAVWGATQTSVLPVGFMVMKAIGIVETQPRDFLIKTETDTKSYENLGFSVRSDHTFPGYIRFQFGDVRLVCVSMFDPTERTFIQEFSKSTYASVASSLPDSACVTIQKDELRVVQRKVLNPLAACVPTLLGVIGSASCTAKRWDFSRQFDQVIPKAMAGQYSCNFLPCFRATKLVY